MPDSNAAPMPGDRAVRVGGVLFVLGAVGVLLVLALYFSSGRRDVPLWATLVASLGPLGLAVALLGLLRGARAGRRAAKQAARRSR